MIELVIDLTNPTKTSCHRKVGSHRVGIGQQITAALRRKVSQTVKRIRGKDHRRLVETEVVETVVPHAELERLGLGQNLFDRKAPDILIVGVDEWRKALVVIQTTAARARTIGIRNRRD